MGVSFLEAKEADTSTALGGPRGGKFKGAVVGQPLPHGHAQQHTRLMFSHGDQVCWS